MVSGIWLEILFIALLIALNGSLAMAEIAIVSSRKARLQQMVNEGNTGAEVALQLANEPSNFLSTIQIGITLVGILAGAFGGATIARQLGDLLRQISVLQRYAGVISIGLVVIVLAYLNLILGELAPKRFALLNPERVASTVAVPVQRLARLTAPLIRFLSLSTNLALRALGVRSSVRETVTEEEIKVMIDQATEAGIFHAAEQDMVEGVLRLGDRRVSSILTPRTEVVWLDLEDPAHLNLQKIRESHFTRFPAARGNLDQIEGIVHAKDVLKRCLEGSAVDLRNLLTEPLFIPESTPALRALELMRESGQQMLLVIDEYGGLHGLVTLEDLLQAVVGEFPARGIEIEPGITHRADGSLLVDGLLPIDEFREALGLTGLPVDVQKQYETVGGFVMTNLRRIPVTGDRFYFEGYQFEVVDMDGMRIDKILVTPTGNQAIK
jgi:putative hemolysin